MSRLAETLSDLGDQGRKALVTFITAGDPDPSATVPALHALVAGGADVLELGVPFSDPEAEGPVIQASSERALANGTTLLAVLDMVARFRAEDDRTPIVLMGYLNSVLAMGIESFAEAAGKAGVDGLIMVNLPPEEAAELRGLLLQEDIDLVFLVAPTTTRERAALIAEQAGGFVYYVSLKGITGADHLEAGSVTEQVAALKAITDLPVLVGFGIKDGATARVVAETADGVVVGSALVRTMAGGAGAIESIPERLTSQLAEIRRALDA
ncbi:MAG: tryptophan synthase subunit alpha [Pseudomonadales bacterium]|nr:tryptophan synthase subunit alpha [Pseudomonadales bacterium]NIX08787.1 tryptophan synthase subunit alpha [Pseudomonadales bacterium]